MAEFRSPNMDQGGYMYGKFMIAPGVYALPYRWGVFSYLVVGGEKALLIDTAYGDGNLRQMVEEITGKPVMVVNTHNHFDHTGGNPWWPEAYAGAGAEPGIKKAFSPEQQEAFNQKPYPDYTVHTVGDGYQFDLGGGRKVEAIEIPAHSETSIALLDHGSRTLFTGDEMEAGQVLLFVRENNIPLRDVVGKHQANMRKLKDRAGEYDRICPAHNGPVLDPSYVDDFIALSQSILDGTANVMPDTAGFGFPPAAGEGSPFGGRALERAQYGGASFVYLKE